MSYQVFYVPLQQQPRPAPQQTYNPVQHSPAPQQGYSPTQYNPLQSNEQRIGSMLQANPHLAGQFAQPQPQAPVAVIVGLKGREVSGIEEARAAQIDFDGIPHYFIDHASQRIYVRYLANNGLFAFDTYALQAPEVTPPPNDGGMEELRAKFAELENRLNSLGGHYEQSTATNRNPTKQQQPQGLPATDGGERSVNIAGSQNDAKQQPA